MSQGLRFFLWLLLSVVLLLCGALMPAHLKGIDQKLLETVQVPNGTLLDIAARYLHIEQVGVTRMLSLAADRANVPGRDQLATAVQLASIALPKKPVFAAAEAGLASPGQLFESGEPKPIIDVLLERTTREAVFNFLQTSRRPGTRQILATRGLTNTTQFSASGTAAGQPWDAVIALVGLLSQTEYMSAPLRDQFENLASQSATNVQALENAYATMLSLGKRLEWNQLGELTRLIEDLPTLDHFADLARSDAADFPVYYTAAIVTADPAAISKYIKKYPALALNELSTGLRLGKGALTEITVRQQRVYSPRWRMAMIGYNPFGAMFDAALPLARNHPQAAFALRAAFFVLGCLCLARALTTLTTRAVAGEIPTRDGTTVAVEVTLAVCLLAVLVIAAEPFLTSDTPARETPTFKVQIPGLGGPISQHQKPLKSMNSATLIPLVVFFIIQGALYIWSLTRLAEIRRDPIEARIKLKLLENEDHLFDAGLYVGFAGTVISLILVSMGIITQSIMAAYASTSFGIIFVSILKIFHIRPFRRQLILETEQAPVTE